MLRSKSFFLSLGAVAAAGTVFYCKADKKFAKMINLESSHRQDISLPMNWKPASRKETLEKMQVETQEYDILIIGGGATGTGIALDAASRGLNVALVERDDFGAGTSSKSTKLVHGGVRYLEKAFLNFDKEQFNLVQEALSERFTYLKIAPYLATQLPIMCPLYKWWQVPYYWAGTKAYDLVAGFRGLKSSYFLTKSRTMEEFPMLKADNLVGAVVYYDGQMNDTRMNVALALTAESRGAHVANHVEVLELLKKRTDDGRQVLSGAVVKDVLSGKIWKIKAKGVINATGPYSDAIIQMDNPSAKNIVAPSSGTHIVLPDYFCPQHMGLIDPSTSDGRVIFVLPWEGSTIVGTTDNPTNITFSPSPTEEEINFILKELARYINPEIKLTRADVLSAWTGIRPLVRNPNAGDDTASLVRNHLIHVAESGLLTISGGKWTTYRKMAEESVDKSIEVFGLHPNSPCKTEDLLLIGSHGYDSRLNIRLIQEFGMEKEVADHLVHNYGDRAFAVAELSFDPNQRKAIADTVDKRLAYPYPFLEGEVRYACRKEYACTANDVIARRTRLAFLNVQATLDSLPRVIEIMTEELHWTRERAQKEFEEARKFLQSFLASK